MADRYAVIGNPIEHSKSPLIHAAFARQTRQDIEYGRILAPLNGFLGAVLGFRNAGGKGLNVTVPFKLEAFRMATRLTQRAQDAEAVNTIKFEGDVILGDNTDGTGLVADIQQNHGGIIANRRVLLLGAGGAARGVICPLLDRRPASLTLANRSVDKAESLQRHFGGITVSSYEALPGQTFDIVINATSAGLTDTALPITSDLFSPNVLAYDMVYGRETPFMIMAREQGATVADGLGMLVEQAAESFFIWRGVRPETASVIQLLRG
jgi:shikimate dehydrogenase